MIHGKVLDAVNGKPVASGTVETSADCTGAECAPANTTPIKNGEFTFKGTITLHPETLFLISATGFNQVLIAHGPKVSLEGETIERSATELMTVYVCTQQADDTDHDNICDDAEKRYGTKPDSRDSDGDALSDTLELYGHPYGAYEPAYDIYSLGADPTHRDIFLAVRFTQKSKLNREAFPLVRQAFAKAPALKDSKAGINLHILFDDRPITGRDDYEDFSPVWTLFDQIKPAYFGDRPIAFHHVLFANKYNGLTSSGVSRGWGAAELLVTLWSFSHGTALQQAGTLMHELGHNLGLHHNGYTDEEFVPHYMSIMSYAYQMTGIERTGGTATLDFSNIEIAPFNEADINEKEPFKPAGTTTLEMLKTYLSPRSRGRQTRTEMMPRLTTELGQPSNLGGPIDFNGDKKITQNVKFDVNRDKGVETFDYYPKTRNDWTSLEYGGGPLGPIGDVFGTTGNNRTVGKSFEDMPPCLSSLEASADALNKAATPGAPASGSSTPTTPSTPSATPSTPGSTPSTPASGSNQQPAAPKKPEDESNGGSERETPERETPEGEMPDASAPEVDAGPTDEVPSVPNPGPGEEIPDAAVEEPDAAAEEPWTPPGESPAMEPEPPIDPSPAQPPEEPMSSGGPDDGAGTPPAEPAPSEPADDPKDEDKDKDKDDEEPGQGIW